MDKKNKPLSLVRRQKLSYSGPIPPPDALAKYEEIHPGLADRIMIMAEKQSHHRQDLEKSVVSSNIKNEKAGQWMAFVLTTILMTSSFYLIAIEKDVAAYFALFAPVIFHAGNYVWQKTEEKKATSLENDE